jgi:hypothetical protein
MTVLSRALTAETPSDRFVALLEETNIGASHWEVYYATIIEQFYTNERALFIAAMRGEIKVTDGNQTCEAVQKDTTGRSEPRQPAGPATMPSSVTPPASPPLAKEPPAGNQDDAERTALIKRLQDYNTGLRLPVEVFNRHRERGVAYPEGAVARLEYLRALPMSWLRYIVTGKNGEAGK